MNSCSCDESLESRLEPEVKGRIIGAKVQMSSYYILFGLKLCEWVMKITDNLSRTLQSQSLSAAQSYGLVKMTITTLQKMRTEENFDLFFQKLELLQQEHEIDEPSLPRKRKRPSWFEPGNAEPHHSNTVADHYRRQYFEVLDLAVTGISSCFKQQGYATYCCTLETLLLKAAKRNDFSQEIKEVAA